MIKLSLSLPQSRHPIWIGNQILKKVSAVTSLKSSSSRGFVLADARVKKQSSEFLKGLMEKGWRVDVLWVEGSEKLKDFHRTYPLYEWLLKKGANRDSTLFALGGGVIGDVTGFLAGTFMRGIPWVSVPTTLLAQVDSAVGGKTGLNHQQGKNLIGLFHQPSQVICDVAFLTSLPKREMVSGLGEVIKYGLAFDPSLFELIQSNLERVFHLEPKLMTQIIARCLSWKVKLVEKDEEDRLGIREALNFGHTLGHAFEAEFGFGRIRHGEAVILGMRAALWLSVIRGHLKESRRDEMDSFLRQLPVPSIPRALKTSHLIKRLKWDKKTKNGNTRFVLLRKMGKTILDAEVKASEIREAIETLRRSPM